MATTKSDIYTIQSQATGDNRADGRLLSGKVRQAQATVTFVGDEDANSALISLVELPKGAIVDPSQSYLLHEACGTGVTVDVGFGSDPNGLTASTLDLSSAGKTFLDTVTIAPVTIADGDEVIQIDITAATTVVTAAAELRAVITFVDRY
tara:strand:+ start:543 stop:992 length:450 start_codon:yes stop_codon:yes gene_type:complete